MTGTAHEDIMSYYYQPPSALKVKNHYGNQVFITQTAHYENVRLFSFANITEVCCYSQKQFYIENLWQATIELSVFV